MEAVLIILASVVAPLWIILHYITRWRSANSLSTEEERMLVELWENAQRLEERLRSLETILDHEVPQWREKT
ncbi:MAG TPA: envelope stress response membrane protein PspB [Candidatus Competibacteraceae bacterium]|nr:envelope stress response membrane protein PspB [Candidatus Competibacteraceae bacterium]